MMFKVKILIKPNTKVFVQVNNLYGITFHSFDVRSFRHRLMGKHYFGFASIQD